MEDQIEAISTHSMAYWHGQPIEINRPIYSQVSTAIAIGWTKTSRVSCIREAIYH